MDWQDMTSGYGDWIAVCGSVRGTGVWKCRWWQRRPIINSSLGHLIQPQPSQAMMVNLPDLTNASECIVIAFSLGNRLRTGLSRTRLPTCRVLQLHVTTAGCICFKWRGSRLSNCKFPLDTSLPPFKETSVMVNLLLRLMLGASDWVPSLLPQFNEGEDRWQAKCEKGG